MNRSYHRWFSPALQRDMELLVFGHAGARVLAFPSSCGRFFDWEDRGLVGSLGEHFERGWIQLICVDSVDRESWYAFKRPPGERAWRHAQYDQYVSTEVVPFSLQLNNNPFLISTGPSFGGYHAVNFGLRHPDQVRRVLGMSGVYDIRRFVRDHYDNNVYFNNPCDYIAGEQDPDRLASLRGLDIILAVGRDDPLIASNRRLSEELWDKGVWHALRVWDGFAHDWPVWEKMLHLYLAGPG
jgi:esterase/lipase superfamily enzyme